MSIYQILGVEPKYPPEMISSETNGSGEIEPMGIYDVLGVEPSEENQEIRAKILETANKEGKELAKEVVAEIRMLRSLDVKKYTLLLKYEELKNHLARDPDYEDKVRRTIEKTMNFEDVKACIEQDENEVEIVKVVKGSVDFQDWNNIRVSVASHIYKPTSFRSTQYLVKINGKIAGIIETNSGMVSIKARDDHIGWTPKKKAENLKHLAMGGSIIPVQPLGFMATGGKLLSLLLYHKIFQDDWERKFGDVLTGMVTTSLYGKDSQYSKMKKYWLEIGETTGKFMMYPRDFLYDQIRAYNLKRRSLDKQSKRLFQEVMGESGTNKKARTVDLFFRNTETGGRRYLTLEDKKRGVYMAEFYADTIPFLKGGKTEHRLQKSKKSKTPSPEERDRIESEKQAEIEVIESGTLGFKEIDRRTRQLKEDYREDIPVLEFDPTDAKEILKVWKKNWAKRRFDEKREVMGKDEQFFMSIRKDDGSIITEAEFIAAYSESETESGEAVDIESNFDDWRQE